MEIAKASGLLAQVLQDQKDEAFEPGNIIIPATVMWQLDDLVALLEAMEYIAQQRQERWPREKTTALLYERLSEHSYPAITVRMQAIESALRLMDFVSYLGISELYDALLYRFIGLHQNNAEFAAAIALHRNVDLAKRIYGLLGTVHEYLYKDNSPFSEFYKDISAHLPSNLYTAEGQNFIETFCLIAPEEQKSFVESLRQNGWYLKAVLRYYINNPAAAALELPYGATLWVVSKRLQAFDRSTKKLNLSNMFPNNNELREEFNEILPLLLSFLESLLGSTIHNLQLFLNQLRGAIPASLGLLTELQELNLSNNKLSGSIPVELGQLINLKNLYLAENLLTGEIPPSLGQLTELQELNLSNNKLSGSIPVELGQLINLKNLYLAENLLTGEIPPSLGQLINLQELYLYNNQLSGSIPAELGQLTALQELIISDNPQLETRIPFELNLLRFQTGLKIFA